MKRIPSRQFTAEYKHEAVKLVFEQQIPRAQVARQLGISIKSLHNWVAQHRAGQLKGSQGIDKLTTDQLRIRDLERELAIAKMERDILKKGNSTAVSRRTSPRSPNEVRLD